MENPKSFKPEELARVPKTKIRIVNYQKETMYGCTKRGVLSGKTVRLSGECERTWGQKGKSKGKGTKSRGSARTDTDHYVGREAAASEVGANVVDQRVAANCNIFLNMIHEGLVYLGAVQQGRIVLNNADSPVMTLGSSPKAIATMFYANDVLVFFHAILYNVLRTQDILRAYNLNENLDYLHCGQSVPLV